MNFGVAADFFGVTTESPATCRVPFSVLRWNFLEFLSYGGNHMVRGFTANYLAKVSNANCGPRKR